MEDERRLSPERGGEDSHQLDISSRMEAGEGGYSCPMEASEFDTVASASLSDKEAGPSTSRATEEEVNCGRFSVAKDADSVCSSVADDADSASCPLAKVLDSVSPSMEKELDSASGSEVKEVD